MNAEERYEANMNRDNIRSPALQPQRPLEPIPIRIAEQPINLQRKNASKDAKIINARTKSIVEAYNNIVELCAPIFQTKETERIKSVRETLITIRDRLLTCAGIKT